MSSSGASAVPDRATVLVTVGTTRFEALIQALDDCADELIQLLAKAGYRRLVLQTGTGTFQPSKLLKASSSKFEVQVFTFSHTFKDVLATAGLIVSHAGAGTIVEVLRMPAPAPRLLVVVNTLLMDNHQLELADALASAGYLFHAEPDTVVKTLREADWGKLKPYPPIADHALPLLLNHELG